MSFIFKPAAREQAETSLPSFETVRAILSYEPETGQLRWKWRGDVSVSVNSRIIGRVAGSRNKIGYVEVGIGGKVYLAHRLIWLLMTGMVPRTVDHKDGDPSNNRFENLRSCTQGENTMNRRRKGGRLLPKGVTPVPCGKFRAAIRTRGRATHIGHFETIEEASAAYNHEAIRLHGEFARTDAP